MPDLIDIHSHLNFSAFKDDADEVIKRTLDNNVWTILVGSQNSTSKRALEYAKKYPFGICAAVGFHPSHLAANYNDPHEEDLDNNAGVKKSVFDYDFYKNFASDKKVVAIGECGLEYVRGLDALKKEQIEVFERQIELALEVNKPLMIHCRDAHKDMIQVLKKHKTQAGDKLRGNIHFFSGTWEEAKEYFNLNFSISFTGVITFTNDYDEIIKKSPLDKIMVETDAPYVAPAPFRGKRNEPLYVKYVVQRIAEIKGAPFEEIKKATTQNALGVFGI